MSGPSLEAIREAAARIAPYVHRTPVVTSRTVDRELGAAVFFKCENLQKVGAFKARGAVNAVLALDAARAARGVITHSSGNHAAALAYAASIRGIRATVVMPESAPAIKVAAVLGYGAEIVFCARAERAEICRRLEQERDLTMIHPFEHPDVIAGQATVALELLEQVERLDRVVAPVGGGGLLAGTAIVVGTLAPGTAVWGAEPDGADDARRSLESGILEPPVADPHTVADGLLTGLGRINFDVLRERGVRVITVSDEEILRATQFFLERMKLVVEPSAATVLAALRAEAPGLAGLRVGAILSGGNARVGIKTSLGG